MITNKVAKSWHPIIGSREEEKNKSKLEKKGGELLKYVLLIEVCKVVTGRYTHFICLAHVNCHWLVYKCPPAI